MPLGLYLDTPQGRKPATLPTHFSLHDFRNLIRKKAGNPEHFDYSLGGVIFRTYNEEVFNRERSAIRDGITLLVQHTPVLAAQSDDDDGPAWRRATPGLCLDGFCLNVKCAALQHRVISSQGLGQFQLVTDSSVATAACPLCGATVQPTTCAFNRCSWRVSGAKRDAPTTNVTTEWQNSADDYHRWADELSAWTQLTIETRQ